MSLSIRFLRTALLTTTLVTAICGAASADVRLPAVFSNHMVLQRDMPVPVWGWAAPGEKVAVVFGDQTQTVVTDDEGRWRVNLERLSVGKPRSLVVEGNNRLELKDVLVGEVWLCSGQSNMQWALDGSADSDLERAGANQPEIRLLTVAMAGTQQQLDDFDGAWEVCSPGTARNFSAVGYHFGRRLQQTLDVPIGLIDNAWGGSSCEAWVPQQQLAEDSLYASIVEQWGKRETQADESQLRAEFAKRHEEWKKRMQQAVAAGRPIPNWPHPGHPLLGQHRPGNLFNSRVAPLLPFAIRGAIWYQGESNADRAQQYRQLFPLMIESWRAAWGQGDFPFYWVQLADFKQHRERPGDSAWAELREAQTMTLDRLPNTGQAVIIDLGEGKDIHPRNKRSVADRLARWALATLHDVPVAFASPRLESFEVKDGKAIVTLKDCGRGLRPFDTKEVRGFDVVGEEGNWVIAQAEIVAPNQVAVWSDQVARPVAVRYAWADNPICNLYAENGLPATPFRTNR